MTTLQNAHTNQMSQEEGLRFQTKLLHDLLDLACDELFEQYNANQKITSRIISFSKGGEVKTSRLKYAAGLLGLDATLDSAAAKLDADGHAIGCAIIYLVEQGAEIVFLLARVGNRQALSLLRLDRNTGLAVADFSVVKKWPGANVQDIYFWELSHWRGRESAVTVELISSAECAAPAFGA